MITSKANQHIKWVRSLQSKRSARSEEGMFVIEGTRLIEEFLHTGQPAHLILYTSSWASRHPELLEGLDRPGTRVEEVSDSVLVSCSAVETPQGVLVVLPIEPPDVAHETSLVLVLDRLSDPGNLGTILRTALAAQVDRLYLTPGSVDVFNPKVVRAAMGAHFNLDIQEASLQQILAGIEGHQLWIADARQGHPYHLVDWQVPVALAIGSEAHGLDPELESPASGRVHIPIARQSESLNAATAAAVILFEIRRQRDS